MNRNLAILTLTLVWIPLGLVLDRGSSLAAQHAIGVVTWLLLIGLLRGETPATRTQVGVVVVLSTLVEYTASPGLGFYTYRLDNVPAFVPPGHGLVYLSAFTLGQRMSGPDARRWLWRAAMMAGSTWVLWGLTLASRPDVFGTLLFGLFLCYAVAGRAPGLYAAAFFITSYLEIVGTWLGAWTWAPLDPSGLLATGNPPSGVAGAYCLLDSAVLAATPIAARCLVQWRGWSGGRLARQPARPS